MTNAASNYVRNNARTRPNGFAGMYGPDRRHQSRVEPQQTRGSRSCQSELRCLERQRLCSLQAKQRRHERRSDSRIRPRGRTNSDGTAARRRLRVVPVVDEVTRFVSEVQVHVPRRNPNWYTLDSRAFTHLYTDASLSTTVTGQTVTAWPIRYVATTGNVTLTGYTTTIATDNSAIISYDWSVERYVDLMRVANFNAQPPVAPPSVTAQQIEAAQQRALDLLMSCLTEEQREHYRLHKCFRVVSNKGNIFEITHARMHNVFRLDMAGQRIEEWCVVALGQVPICDGMLAQKMWLETDEDHVMQRSNITVLRNGQLIHRAAEALQFSYARDAAYAAQVQQVFQ